MFLSGGTIEGFYGLPWGQEGRISQFKFYGKYKMNTYIYGPKDDVFHGFSKRWREPYPADMAKDLKELVKVAKQNKVNFRLGRASRSGYSLGRGGPEGGREEV